MDNHSDTVSDPPVGEPEVPAIVAELSIDSLIAMGEVSAQGAESNEERQQIEHETAVYRYLKKQYDVHTMAEVITLLGTGGVPQKIVELWLDEGIAPSGIYSLRAMAQGYPDLANQIAARISQSDQAQAYAEDRINEN